MQSAAVLQQPVVAARVVSSSRGWALSNVALKTNAGFFGAFEGETPFEFPQTHLKIKSSVLKILILDEKLTM